jgi:hypothetical protein
MRPFGSYAATLLILSLPGLVQAQQIITSPAQSSAQTAAYWTAERKASAQPMPLRSVSGTPQTAPAAVLNAGKPAGSVAGNLPAGATLNAAARSAAAAIPAAAAPTFGPGSTIWYQYPPPSTLSIPTLDYFVVPLFPNTALGKLFFDGPGGRFVCSAQSVTSAGSWGGGNRQTVVTAGHCCSGGGAFFSNWLFEPAHFSGATPLGGWTAQTASVFTAWLTTEDLSVDLCVLKMFKTNGQNINDAAGALGYAWNQPLPQHYVATGWPQAAPFSGGLLYYAMASDAETDTEQAGLLLHARNRQRYDWRFERGCMD